MLANATAWRRRQAKFALLFPIAGLLGFSGYVVSEKIALLDSSTHLQAVADLTKSLNGLVHELQRERGLAALTLAGFGRIPMDNLVKQFDATNQQRRNFERSLSTFTGRRPSPTALRELDSVRHVLERLIAQRARLESGEIAVPETIESYSGAISAILETASRLPNATPMSRVLSAWTQLARAKEEMGRERAIGSALLAGGRVDLDLYARLNQVRATQETFVATFMTNATPEQRLYYDSVFATRAAREAEALRHRLVAEVARGSIPDVSPGLWYDAMTRKIDLVKSVEDKIAEDVESLVQDNATRAAVTVVLTALVVVLLLLLSWVSLRHSERRAQRSAERLVNAIEQISDGFALWDPEGTLILSNSRLKQLGAGIPESLNEFRRANAGRAAAAIETRTHDGRWLLVKSTLLDNGERAEIYSDVSEQKRREQLIEASEQRLRRILENIGEGIITIGEDGAVRSFNRAAEIIFGRPAATVIGRHVSILTGEMFGSEGGPLEKVVEGSPSVVWYEGRVLRADGRPLLFQAAITGLRLAEEKLLVGIFRDVTEQRNAEEQLRKLFRAVEQSPISVIITDPQGRIEYTNATFRATTGYSSEEVAGQTMASLKSGVNAPDSYGKLWSTISAGHEWRGELCNRKKNGQLFWEMVTISPVVGPDGAVVNFIGLREDITGLKNIQRALEIEHENTRRILESMNDGICLIDEKFDVRYANAALEADFGAVGARKCHEYLYASPGPCVRCAFAGAEPSRFEWHARRTGKIYEVVETQIQSGDGSPMKLCVFHDITTHKEAEAALARARSSAEAANRAKTEFLAAMSHELRTPLNAVIGFSEIIAGQILGPVDERYAAYANDIHASGQHLLALINDVLDVAAIEVGRIVLRESAVDVMSVIDATVGMLRERAERAAVAMTLMPSPDLPLLTADERRIKQILVNLLSNAIKFTPAGGKVEVSATLSQDGEIVIKVADTGIGIAPEDIPRALAPFEQVDSSLSRRYEGSGLGLPLTKGLADLHGAEMELDSEPGKGTVVTIRFPRNRTVLTEPTPADWSI